MVWKPLLGECKLRLQQQSTHRILQLRSNILARGHTSSGLLSLAALQSRPNLADNACRSRQSKIDLHWNCEPRALPDSLGTLRITFGERLVQHHYGEFGAAHRVNRFTTPARKLHLHPKLLRDNLGAIAHTFNSTDDQNGHGNSLACVLCRAQLVRRASAASYSFSLRYSVVLPIPRRSAAINLSPFVNPRASKMALRSWTASGRTLLSEAKS